MSRASSVRATERVRVPMIRKALRVGGAGVLFAGVAAMAIGASVMWPISTRPTHADAIVVLSGDHGERLARAKQMIAAGVATTLVLVGTPDSLENLEMCRGDTIYDVICLRPEPDSTRAEARATAALARARGWRDLAVVTSTPHVTRARLLFDRCWSGGLTVTGADLRYGGAAARRARVHEWLGLVYALTALRC